MKSLDQPEVVEEVRSRMAALRPDDARRWGTMSVEEMMAHVREAYVLSVSGRISERVVTPVPQAMMKYAALKLPMQWPHNVRTVTVLERVNMPATEDFERELGLLQLAFEGFLRAEDKTAAHAYFGPMDAADWMRWGYLHADHHLRQFGR